ncbi:hypothetical protein CR3_0809 [Cupriavidus gilardii CR3]|uniref:Uncharacterized protein n=1 Tax=Cupriavidus gilardii TaxID=82541 RepID=A0A849B549_9BURK|nr:hypothetical protein [Cupriavidus gilardii]ALD90056.1 hypothetical protein CR3_0809 [Cupriavidus gilardii CR3]KAB0598534.1 hypothetical protein F7Q96_02945 [Cupriavidus gilardii]MCT9015055.1 hypothetical protein [Cupriavidus gilardii]MCT9054825.1 hypothetical protein [Cupriavidus gilardii]NNH09298.1 hypothetical protein [Cupriavidus gilardii]
MAPLSDAGARYAITPPITPPINPPVTATLPANPPCGEAPLELAAVQALAIRLHETLDVALHYGLSDGIDLHVCDLRQLANWGVPISEQERELYFHPWTIDASDPVFPVTLVRLREFIAAIDGLLTALARPDGATPAHPAPPTGRTFG